MHGLKHVGWGLLHHESFFAETQISAFIGKENWKFL